MYKTLLCAAALLGASAANAATSLNFNTSVGHLGTSQGYTNGALSVTATGYSSNSHTTDLYGKSNPAPSDENGLGLYGFSDNEISYPGTDFIQVYMHDLFGLVTGGKFFMGSSTNHETWKVYGSNSAGMLGSVLIASGGDELLHDLTGWGQYDYYDFVATGTQPCGWCQTTSGNVLLGGLSLTPSVPELSTWAMMLFGFAGMGTVMRRKRAQPLPQVA